VYTRGLRFGVPLNHERAAANRFTGAILARQIDNLPERPPNRDIRQLAQSCALSGPIARAMGSGIALVVAAGCVLAGQG